MQISKSLLVICAAVFCSIPRCVRAGDTEAQLKARQALEQELKAAPPPPTPAPAAKPTPPPPAAPAPAAAKAPAPVVLAAPPPAPVAAPKADPEAIAKAREALRQAMAEQPAQPQPMQATPQAVPPPPPAPAAAAAQTSVLAPAVIVAPAAASVSQASPTTPGMVAAPKALPEEIAAAREALRQKMSEMPPLPEEPAAPVAGTFAPMHQPVSPPPPKVAPGQVSFQQIQAPALPISADKQQRLAELLARYRADQLTPEQYHAERAKILAEP